MSPMGLPPGVEVLAPLVEAGALGPTEVHLSATFARLAGGLDDLDVLALAAAARGAAVGHSCIVPSRAPAVLFDMESGAGSVATPWPDERSWVRHLRTSPVVASPEAADEEPLRPLVWDGERLYLQRYFHYEQAVASFLADRAGGSGRSAPTDAGAVDAAIEGVFGPGDSGWVDDQREAARRALSGPVTVIAGGPGTGKTWTVARLLAAELAMASGASRPLRVALAAPTGKAAARLTEAVGDHLAAAGRAGLVAPGVVAALGQVAGTTLHRLVGAGPAGRLGHGPAHPLPVDLVVVDETSMVSLSLLAKLLAALRPTARLVLVGDPFQLPSIEAGTVLRDLAGPALTGAPASGTGEGASGPLAGRVVVLRTMHRYGAGSPIATLAEAVRVGDEEAVLAALARSGPAIRWVHDDDPTALAALEDEVCSRASAVVQAARDGDPGRALEAAQEIKVLAATRRGPRGRNAWTARIERRLAGAVLALGAGRRFYAGQPVIVTANDPANRVSNGDLGVMVQGSGGLVVAMATPGVVRTLSPARLAHVETAWAMTIHKAQGSEFPHVVVSLPDPGAPILSRELLYTAVTRARQSVTLVASEAAVRAAVRRPVERMSGLSERLWAETPETPCG